MQEFFIDLYFHLVETFITACLAEVTFSYWAEKWCWRRILSSWAIILVAHKELSWLISYIAKYI